ncbi:MAG TPA: hypothetical protein VK100_10090 [Pseudogracilibacillus sp.]|nr:hypothetical protein [Pseudogracilibacillus sp.]
MNKKWMVVIISLLLLVVLIGVGGKMYMDKRAKQKEDEKIEIERKSVEALKERYANIKTVEIEKTAYNKMTGAYSLYVKMTNDKSESVNFSYTFWEKREEIGAAGLENEEVQVKGVTKDKVRVIYSNNKEEDV